MQFQLNTLDDPVIPLSGEGLDVYTKGYTFSPGAPGAFPISEIQSQSFFRLNEVSSCLFLLLVEPVMAIKPAYRRSLWWIAAPRRLGYERIAHGSVFPGTTWVYPTDGDTASVPG